MVRLRSAPYVPERGDVVWLQFTPQRGREQAGRRPALVISPGAYNGKLGLALMCPITSKVKGYPFEVGLAASSGEAIAGVVLADQVKSLDWQARHASFACRATADTLKEVLGKLRVLL